MGPRKWDDEEESTPPSSPPQAAITRRSKFDDEEEDSDVVEDWEAADDSEAEAEKAKKAAEAKAKADAEAAANKKSKSQRIEERRTANLRKAQEEEDFTSEDEEDEAARRERLQRTEQDADLKHAQDLFDSLGVKSRTSTKTVISADPSDPGKAVDLASHPLFNPSTKDQFLRLRQAIAPIVALNTSKAHYVLFLQEFVKDLSKDLPSDQIKKIASGLTTLSNEKLKEEKATEKGGKKTKAAKTKSSLVASRSISSKVDTTTYDDGLQDDDFM